MGKKVEGHSDDSVSVASDRHHMSQLHSSPHVCSLWYTNAVRTSDVEAGMVGVLMSIND